MRRLRSVLAIACASVLGLAGCAPASDCAPDGPTATVRAAKPGVASVQCWSGCADGVRLLERSGDDRWTVPLAGDRPAAVTLAARADDGTLRFAQRFRLEWAGCPAVPAEAELVLLRPEGGG
ncbi:MULTISPECIES: hypothetical protein [unclassified Agromyces]|uniref:hypothetical protein n=1 Tax=unclassified Agromyces TaxID=2639701 RepID=UPI0030152AB4